MTSSLVLALLATNGVPLTPFVDDGGTKTHALEPSLLVLKGTGKSKSNVLRVGRRAFRVEVRSGLLGETLLVDKNGDGKVAPGESIPWNRRDGKLPDGSSLTAYEGEVALNLGGGIAARYAVRLLASNTKDPGFAQVRGRLSVIPLFGYLGRATFGGTSYRIGIRGGDPGHAALFIDRDGDGVLGTVPQELFDLDKPFSLGGKSYRMTAFRPDGRPSIAFGPAAERVAERPMPPDLRVGGTVPAFVTKDLKGRPVAFPKAFVGKIVMLDLWATWCGPCRAEIPYMKDVHARFGTKGFEIVSVSLDDEGMQHRLANLVEGAGMRWTHLFSANGFGSAVARRFDVSAIPFSLLVDGSTGRILASGIDLRGPNLLPTVAWEMAKRRQGSNPRSLTPR